MRLVGRMSKGLGWGWKGFFQWRGVTEGGLGNIGLGELEF